MAHQVSSSAESSQYPAGYPQPRSQRSISGSLDPNLSIATAQGTHTVHRSRSAEVSNSTSRPQHHHTSSQDLRVTTVASQRSRRQQQQPQHSSNTTAASMIYPPGAPYEFPHSEIHDDEGYQRWVEAFQQGQYDQVVQMPYQQAAHPAAGMTSMPEMARSQPQMAVQGQYGYHPGQFVQPGPSNSSEMPYNHQLVQGRSPERQVNMTQASITHQFSRQEQSMPVNTMPADYSAPHLQHGARQLPSTSTISHALQQPSQQSYAPQQAGSFPQRQQQPQPAHSTNHPFYFQPTSADYAANSGQQQTQQNQQPFTFTHFAPRPEQFASPGDTFPSSNPATLASSVSPPPWTGTDDGQPQHPQHPQHPISGTPPQPSQMQAAQTVPNPRVSPQQSVSKRGRGGAKNAKGQGKPPAKRRRPSDMPEDGESGSDDDDYMAPNSALPPLKGPDNVPTRAQGACSHCKRLKMKCEFPSSENTCKRCKATGHHCIVEGRKRRNIPSKREYLLAQIRQKDAVIESLLKQLHNPYLATPLSVASYRTATSPSDQNNQNVLAWLDRLEASVRTAGRSGGAKAFGLSSRIRAGEADHQSDDDSDRGSQHDPTERGTTVGQPVEKDTGEDEARGLQPPPAPDDSVPMGLIANLSLNHSKRKSAKNDDEGSTDEDDVGFANETYFKPGPAYDLSIRAHMIEQNSPPEILVHGLVTPDDVENLFKIYYARLNVHVSLLDPVLHTPASTFTRCPFLFTVVCAISSRYYEEKSEIYPIAMHFAKHAAANAMITGWKSVELAQAYILLSVFSVPDRRWEEHRGWLYIGLAARLATDLNLHQVNPTKPTTERQEREMLNRVRLWLNCFNLDRSTATQYGKPYSIKEDYIIRTSADWYKASKYNGPFDIGLCAYTAMLRVVSRFHDEVFSDPDTPSGLNLQLDFLELTTTHDNHLTEFYTEWTERFTNDSDLSDAACAFRSNLLPFFTSYARLVMWSFGFQQAYKRGMQGRDHVFLDKCYEYATTVVTYMVDKLAPSGYVRFSPDGHFVFSTFASAFLLKLLKPEFSRLITRRQHDDIFDLIGRLIHTFMSEEISIDDRHTPKLHARFLTTLLSRHRRDVSNRAQQQQQQQPPAQSHAGPGGGNGGGSAMGTGSAGPTSHTSSPEPNQPTQSHSSRSSSATLSGYSSQVQTPLPTYVAPTQKEQYQQQPHTTFTEDFQFTQTTPSQAPPGDSQQYTAATSEQMMEGFDDELLGALQFLKTPGYWQSMMMPGFHWADAQTKPAYTLHQPIPGIHNGVMQHAGIQYS